MKLGKVIDYSLAVPDFVWTQPECAESCTHYIDGAEQYSTKYDSLCIRVETPTKKMCYPLRPFSSINGGCANYDIKCNMPHVGTFNTFCVDTPGKWANKKCYRKAFKKKRCRKRKVRLNCCETCSRFSSGALSGGKGGRNTIGSESRG